MSLRPSQSFGPLALCRTLWFSSFPNTRRNRHAQRVFPSLFTDTRVLKRSVAVGRAILPTARAVSLRRFHATTARSHWTLFRHVWLSFSLSLVLWFLFFFCFLLQFTAHNAAAHLNRFATTSVMLASRIVGATPQLPPCCIAAGCSPVTEIFNSIYLLTEKKAPFSIHFKKYIKKCKHKKKRNFTKVRESIRYA